METWICIYFRRVKADFQRVMVVFLWRISPERSCLWHGSVEFNENQARPRWPLCLCLCALVLVFPWHLGLPMIAANSTMASEVFGMHGFKWPVCALLLPTSGFQRLLSFLGSKSASPPSYDTIFHGCVFMFTLIFWALNPSAFFD